MKDTLGTQTTYPDFVPNQILTNSQLNELRDHLDTQDRASRKRLVGMGIICGFEWDVKGGANARRIELADGLGLTSEGYLVCLAKTTLNRVRQYKDPAVEDNGTTPTYEPWRQSAGGPQRQIFELVPDNASQEDVDSSRLLRAQDLQNRVLVLYVELEPVELRSCFVTECDNKGQRVNVNLRALLVSKGHLSQVTPCEPPLDFFRVPRLHTVKKLGDIRKANDIDVGYRTIVRQRINPLVTKIEQAFTKFQPFLDLESSHLQPIQSRFRTAVQPGAGNQYHYDALKDMATAYNDFVEAACSLGPACCPDGDFPRHLMLGAIDGTEGFRNRFLPSAVRNVVDNDRERVRKLFLRMTAIAEAIDLGAAGDIRLTTSRCEGDALGNRAVPYYFLLTNDVRGHWQPELCCTHDKLWSYHDHTHTASGDPSDFGFNDYNRSSFIRIEGHLGDDCSVAKRDILAARRLHNAEFNLLLTSFDDPTTKLSDISNRLKDLLAQRQRVAANYNLQVTKSLVTGGFPVQAMRDLIKEIEELDAKIVRVWQEWARLRCERHLHCDTGHLETMYADIRGELLCLLGGLSAELTRITDAMVSLRAVLPEKRLKLATAMIGVLHGQLRWLADIGLPPHLCAFNYSLFIHRYKELLHDAGRFWLFWRVFSFPVQPKGLEVAIVRPWPGGGEAISASLLTVARGCFHTRLARLAGAFQRTWDSDPSFFPNLVDMVDGLEHLAGVKRCGTFVVVCDRPSATRPLEVRADFALSCRLPCCCDVDHDDCLPIVALDQHRVEILAEKDDEEFEPVKVRIDLRKAGYEANAKFADGDVVPPLKIKLPADTTRLGGKLRLESDGVVRYEHDEPRPGLLDTFSFILISEHPECPGQDEAHVDILMAPPPPEPEEPESKEGELSGHVTFRGKPFSKAAVEVLDLDRHRPLITLPATQGGSDVGFFTSRFAPGHYQIRAVTLSHERGAPESEWVEVQITAGGRVEQDLEMVLPNKPGVVTILVLDRTGVPLKGSSVVLEKEDGLFHEVSEVQGPEGTHVFENVPVGVYAAKAGVRGFVTGTIRNIEVESGAAVSRSLVLAPAGLRLRDGFVHFVAIAGNEGFERARTRATKLYDERYTNWFKTLTRVGAAHPDIGNFDEYETAMRMMTEVLPNPEIDPKTVARGMTRTIKSLAERLTTVSNPTKKTEVRRVMKGVMATYLDRISTHDPETLHPSSGATLTSLVALLNSSGVVPAKVREAWNPAPLRTMRTPVARVIDRSIR